MSKMREKIFSHESSFSGKTTLKIVARARSNASSRVGHCDGATVERARRTVFKVNFLENETMYDKNSLENFDPFFDEKSLFTLS